MLVSRSREAGSRDFYREPKPEPVKNYREPEPLNLILWEPVKIPIKQLPGAGSLCQGAESLAFLEREPVKEIDSKLHFQHIYWINKKISINPALKPSNFCPPDEPSLELSILLYVLNANRLLSNYPTP